jgi:2-dehydropantoate 2-reductase
MNITVIGAGAVGCYYGGMLARAGHDVTMIGRQQHVDAMLRDGLLLETLSFTEYVKVAASTEIDAASVGSAELLLVCVKSDDTEGSAAQIAPFLDRLVDPPLDQQLRRGATILSLQNGVDNALRLHASLVHANPDLPIALSSVAQSTVQATADAAGTYDKTAGNNHTIWVGSAVVYVAASMAGPGHIKHHGRGELVIGPSPHSDALAVQFRAAGIPVQISHQVTSALWEKLVINCAYNALSAITQRPYGVLFAATGIPEVMRNLVDECRQVAVAMQIDLTANLWDAVESIAQSMASQYSSTAQDISRGKRTEIDHLNGYIVRQGMKHGVATPVNHAMTSMVRLLESR